MRTFGKTGRRLAAVAASAALVLASAESALAQTTDENADAAATPKSSFSFLDQELANPTPWEKVPMQPEYRVDWESPVEDPAGVLLTFWDTQSLDALLNDGTYQLTNHAYASATYDNCVWNSANKTTQCLVPYDVELGKTYTLSGPVNYLAVATLTDDDAGVYTARDIPQVDFRGYSEVYGYDPANDNNVTFVEKPETRGGDYYDNYGLVTWETPRG